MEKSNSFKRVLAGTLALLTVASSVPAEAGSVIGDFFNTAIVADASSKPVIPASNDSAFVAVTNVNIVGNAGTATVKVGAEDAVRASITVEPDTANDNVVTLKIAATGAFGTTGTTPKKYATVEGYTVIDNVTDEGTVIYNATATADVLTVKVNKFTALTVANTSNYAFDGEAHSVKLSKDFYGDEAVSTDDTSAKDTLEVSYIDASGKDVVLTEDEIRSFDNFEWSLSDADLNNSGADDHVVINSGVQSFEAENVNRDASNNVVPYVITLKGKGKFEGLTAQLKFQINPKDISNDAVITPINNDNKNNRGKITYSGFKANEEQTDKVTADHGMQFIKSVVTGSDANASFYSDDPYYTATYTAREGSTTDDDNDASTPEVAVNVGKYTATLNFGGNYTGSKTVDFEITPLDIADTLKNNTVTKFNGGDVAENTTNATTNNTIVYDRKNDLPVSIVAQGDNKNPYSLELTTYPAVMDGAAPKVTDGKWEFSTAKTEDYKNVGYYVTKIEATGNYTGTAYVQWQRTQYSIADANGTTGNNRVTVEASGVVDPSTGNVSTVVTVRDKNERDAAAQAGVRLIEGTDYTVVYNKTPDTDVASYKPEIPKGVKTFYAIVKGAGNYTDNSAIIPVTVEESDYEASAATLTTTTETGDEKVQYAYGDNVGARVITAPAALTQEIRYIPATLDALGKPESYDTVGDNNYQTLYQNATKATATDADINALYKATLDADHLVARTGDNQGYVAIVFVNRKGSGTGTDAVAACDNYNNLFKSKFAVSKGFTVSKRTVSQDSTVVVEYNDPLMIYNGARRTLADIKANIKSVTVDGKVVPSEGYTIDYTDDMKNAKKVYKDVDDYSFKIVFDEVAARTTDTVDNNLYNDNEGLAAFSGNDNYTGSYTTNVASQKFSIVAATITANDFKVAIKPEDDSNPVYSNIYAVLSEAYNDETTFEVGSDALADALAADNGKRTITGYKVNTNAPYTGKEIEELVVGKTNVTDVKKDSGSDGYIRTVVHTAAYGEADFVVSGNKQTAPGEYTITIKGIKNTQGSVTVKWTIEGKSFQYFTASANATTFNYNAQPQAPTYTVTRTADANRPDGHKTAVTLTEGKDFTVEYYAKDKTTKLDGAPTNVGTYYAKIVGAGDYFGATLLDEHDAIAWQQFTIAPSADLSIEITPKKDADFTYNAESVYGRLEDLFDFKYKGEKIDTDVFDMVYHLKYNDVDTTDSAAAGKYKVSVTISNANYKPTTSQEAEFTINPKVITLKNIKAGTTAAVYGAPVAQINRSITFDYEGVLDADKDKVSADDFKDYIKVSGNYHSGSPAGEYGLEYNKDYTPSGVAANYKVESIDSNVKITIAKKDLAEAVPYVSLVIVKSDFANNTDYKAADDAHALNANQIVYNGEPYEVFIKDNDNGLLTMADLDFIDTAKALHNGDYTVTAMASATGNYKGNTKIPFDWSIAKCVVDYDIVPTVVGDVGNTNAADDNDNELPSSAIGNFGPGKKYHIDTNVQFYDVDKTTGNRAVANNAEADANGKFAYVKTGTQTAMPYASEKEKDYTVYYTKYKSDLVTLDQSTKTTAYPSTAGKYQASVVLSNDFVLAEKKDGSMPEYKTVDFTIQANELKATITDNNYVNNKTANNFKAIYNDGTTPDFTVTLIEQPDNDDLVTAKVDVNNLYKLEEVTDATAIRDGKYDIGPINGKYYKRTTTLYDGSAGVYDLQNAIVTNNANYTVQTGAWNDNDKNNKYSTGDGFTPDGHLLYTVAPSENYTIQFNQATNIFELTGSTVKADVKVIDNYTGKELALNTDYTIRGTSISSKTGDFTLFVNGKGNYTGEKHAEWKVVKKGDSTAVDAKFNAGNTVSFKDKVEFNFLVDISNEIYADGAYVEFTYNHYGTETKVKKAINKSDMNGTHYRVRLPLTASEMAIDIKAELYLANAAEPVDTKTRSIKDYAEAVISQKLDGADALKAMLNYGGYTQVALHNNTSLLANSGEGIKEDVSSVQPKSATTFVRPAPYEGPAAASPIAGLPQAVQVKFTPKVTYKGSSIMTRSDLFVRHYFGVDSSITDAELKATKVRVGLDEVSLDQLPKSGKNYYLDVAKELVYNLDRNNAKIVVYAFPGTVTNTSSYTASNGQVIAAGTVTYNVGAVKDPTIGVSVENTDDSIFAINIENYNVIDYCEAIANNAGQTVEVRNMAKALFKYYEEAKAYVEGRTAK